MSDIRYNSWLHRSGTGGVYQDSSGRVGIGTSAIGALLAVPAQASGDSGVPRIAIESKVDANDFTISQYEDGTGTYTLLGQNVKLSSGGNDTVLDSSHKTASIMMDGRGNGALMFNTGGANETEERMRIDSSGHVGITSVSPVATRFSGTVSGLINLAGTKPCVYISETDNKDSGGVNRALYMGLASGTAYAGSNAPFSFATGDTSTTERVRIRTDGRVSIASSVAVAGVCTAAAFIPAQGQLSNRNLIINGAMNIAQRGGGTMTAAGSYVPDRWNFWASGGSYSLSMGTLTSGTPYDLGFRKYVRISNSSGASGATDYRIIRYVPEAQDMAKCGWDYTDANSDITLSFWVRSSVAFTPYAYFHTQDGTEKAYIFSLGALSADTWTKIEKTIPGGTGVQFDNDTGAGMKIDFVQFWGTDYTGTVNTDQWVTYAGSTRTPDMSNSWAVASGASFDITGVQLEVGSVATPFEQRSYGEELDRCMRYYEVIMPAASGNLYEFMGMWYSATEFTSTMVWTVPKRAAPTLVHNTGTNYFQAYGGSLSDQFDTWTGMQSASTRAGTIYNNNSITGGTTGHGGWCGSANDAAYIHVSAEL